VRRSDEVMNGLKHKHCKSASSYSTLFLGAFAKLRKTTINFVMSVRVSGELIVIPITIWLLQKLGKG
jgi:hypothetical protein